MTEQEYPVLVDRATTPSLAHLEQDFQPPQKVKPQITSTHDFSPLFPELVHTAQTIPNVENLSFVQISENIPARYVMVHEPNLEVFVGSLHPVGSLYETSVDIEHTRECHQAFTDALKRNGCIVLRVVDVLKADCDINIRARIALERLAEDYLTYTPSVSIDQFKDASYYLSSDYKRENIRKMSDDQLVQIILTRPNIVLSPSSRNTPVTAIRFDLRPLGNLVFCRDQQITTSKGIVMSRLNSSQREAESRIMQFCWEKLGIPVVGKIPEPHFLEGGDFYTVKPDLCMLGVGLRSTYSAAVYLMENDLLGTRRFAVVRDDHDRNQDRMHLDCIFNIIDDGHVLLLEDVMDPNSNKMRYVDEYVRQVDKSYSLKRKNIPLYQFLEDESYQIITVSNEEQLKYACNHLNLGNGSVVGVHKEVARRIGSLPNYKGSIEYVEFDGVTSMYGAAHCATQVFSRY
ncbi:hypothetical protein PCE1_002987 [Barthelona sp. PCE]